MKIDFGHAITLSVVILTTVFSYGMLNSKVDNINATFVNKSELQGRIDVLEAKLEGVEKTVNKIWELQRKK